MAHPETVLYLMSHIYDGIVNAVRNLEVYIKKLYIYNKPVNVF